MNAKLQAIWAKVQPWLAKIWSWSPVACGVAVGYFGHPVIKLALDAVAKVIKLI